MFLLLPLVLLQVSAHDSFMVASELRGLYDEMSQATLEYNTAAELDDFHRVFCTPDWVFIDLQGKRHDWQEMGEKAIQNVSGPPLETMTQTIRQIAVAPGGVTDVVEVTTVRNLLDDRAVVDAQEQYARRGEVQMETATTFFRDTWVETPGDWKLKSREQLIQTKVSVGPLDLRERE